MIIVLHGFLAKKYAKKITLAGENMFQLMGGLTSRFGPQFKEDIRTNDWHLVKGKMKDKNDISQEELALPLNCDILHLVPAITGNSGALRVIVGAVMVFAGIYFQQSWLINMGASMILGGVIEMLTKPNINTPDQSTNNQDQKGSYIYNGAINVTTQGGPIPLVYGRVGRTSSVVITTDFSSDQII